MTRPWTTKSQSQMLLLIHLCCWAVAQRPLCLEHCEDGLVSLLERAACTKSKMPLAMLVHRVVSKMVGMILVLQLAMNVPNLLDAVFLSGTVPRISIFSRLWFFIYTRDLDIRFSPKIQRSKIF